jgi:hypothetical protein
MPNNDDARSPGQARLARAEQAQTDCVALRERTQHQIERLTNQLGTLVADMLVNDGTEGPDAGEIRQRIAALEVEARGLDAARHHLDRERTEALAEIELERVEATKARLAEAQAKLGPALIAYDEAMAALVAACGEIDSAVSAIDQCRGATFQPWGVFDPRRAMSLTLPVRQYQQWGIHRFPAESERKTAVEVLGQLLAPDLWQRSGAPPATDTIVIRPDFTAPPSNGPDPTVSRVDVGQPGPLARTGQTSA